METTNINSWVDSAVREQPVWDMHTHLYAPTFGTPVPNATGQTDPAGLLLWGIDELVTYHYLVAEVYRIVPSTKLPYEQFWKMSKQQQADHIWKHLFVERAPLSEACRGVVTTLTKLGLDPNAKNLNEFRKYFAAMKPSDYIDKVMKVANVNAITMTNEVFTDNERNRWIANPNVADDPRFRPVLRLDPLIRDWAGASKKLADLGYKVTAEANDASVAEVRRFLGDWIKKMKAIYLAVSLPPEFRYPAPSNDPVAAAGITMLTKAILPTAQEYNVPFAMMIGARQKVNPSLGDAGDIGGLADTYTVAKLCADFPNNKFFCTMLCRENQHDLAVVARKFGNLMVFGCWWFMNIPSIIDEITRLRLELLGTTFIPQHSDSRVLDQLIYKWEHSRVIIGNVLKDQYAKAVAAGWKITQDNVKQDVKLLLHDNFANFVAK